MDTPLMMWDSGLLPTAKLHTPSIQSPPTVSQELTSEKHLRKTMIQQIRQSLGKIQGIVDLLPLLEEQETHEYLPLLAQEVRQVSHLLNLHDQC